jgi:hypothetical protein
MLSARPDGAADVVLSSADWALLCKVDGNRDIADLAAECGFTVFEAAHVVRSLIDAGLVDVELPDDEPVASVTSLEDARGKRPAFEPAPDPAADELAGAVKKVTAALGDLFKPVTPPGAGKSLAEAAADLEALETDDDVDAGDVEAGDDPAEQAAREAEERLASEVEAWLEHETWLAEQAKSVEADAWAAHASKKRLGLRTPRFSRQSVVKLRRRRGRFTSSFSSGIAARSKLLPGRHTGSGWTQNVHASKKRLGWPMKKCLRRFGDAKKSRRHVTRRQPLSSSV